MFIYKSLDIFLFAFHTALVLFNAFGWIWRKTRLFNLISLIITLFSWLILGIWYGLGYCFLVDWHWAVKRKLGNTDLPHSYMKYLFDTLTGLNWNGQLVDAITAIGLALALMLSSSLNWRDFKRKARE